ncbi:MAG TPA: hypothetical protein VNT75_10925, partial [Symbiobacteriaceae bacterium]|nr:hypothetical protein [Symbiobacteriaceae bacterium]
LGLPGVGPSNPTHALGRGTIAEGQELWYRLNVTDAGMPIAATLLATDSIENYYDLDLYLYDEAGTELAVAQNVGREEIIIFQPVTRGKYFLKIHGFEGGGPFTLDASWR